MEQRKTTKRTFCSKSQFFSWYSTNCYKQILLFIYSLIHSFIFGLFKDALSVTKKIESNKSVFNK
jgi:hypothetical protein